MTPKQIGIVGAGQAGRRISVALDGFADVQVTGVVDPTADLELLADHTSPWFLKDTSFFKDDDAMLESHEYDALVVAVDPISLFLGSRPKIHLLKTHSFSKPILWERPLGFRSSDPTRIARTLEAVPAHSVMSLSRYGAASRTIRSIIESGQLGDILDFEIFVTLNCGLQNKPWRHQGLVPQPVHFLDSAFEMVDQMKLGTIESVRAESVVAERKGIIFDEKWDISVALDSGLTGRIVGIQYAGDCEALYSLREVRVVGASGALRSNGDSTSIVDANGKEKQLPWGTEDLSPSIRRGATNLSRFFRSVDKYPEGAACLGEALALVECLRAWVDTLSGTRSGSFPEPASPEDCSRYLRVAESAVLSAFSGRTIHSHNWEPARPRSRMAAVNTAPEEGWK